MAFSRALVLVQALLVVALASVVPASHGAAGRLLAIPQVSGPQAMPVTKPNDLAFGAPLRTPTHQTHARIFAGPRNGYLCGGALIGRRTVVTAAHCVDPARKGATLAQLKAGFVRIGGNQLTKGRQYKVQGIVNHPAADVRLRPGGRWPIDLVLVYLTEAVNLKERRDVAVAQLGKPGQVKTNQMVSFAGWAPAIPRKTPFRLFFAKTRVAVPYECNRWLRQTGQVPASNFNGAVEFCVSLLDKVAFCGGDSGGALYTIGRSGGKATAFVHGIFTTGFDPVICRLGGINTCTCDPASPEIVLRTAPLLGWIRPRIKN